MESIPIGVVGLGHWGPNHLRVFNSLPNSRVVAVADTDTARLQRATKSVPGLRAFSSVSALLSGSEATAVVVCTPTSTHFSVVKEILSAGRHVLCEKPLCMEPAEGEELVAMAGHKRLVLMVGHVFLFNPGIVKVKELIDGGAVGTVRCLSAVRTNLGPIRSDVNAVYDLASHDISIFNWLLGAGPTEVQAMGASYIQPGIEDVAVVTMRYPGNVLASIHCSWLDPKKVRHITIVGSRRMITWDDLELSNPVAVYEKSVEANREIGDYGEFLRFSMHEGDVRLPRVPPEEPLRRQAQEFLSAVGENRVPVADGRFGLEVVRALSRVGFALRSTS